MVNTKLDIHICGPTSVFHFDPHLKNNIYTHVVRKPNINHYINHYYPILTIILTIIIQY